MSSTHAVDVVGCGHGLGLEARRDVMLEALGDDDGDYINQTTSADAFGTLTDDVIHPESAEAHAHDRKVAVAWLQKKPLQDVICMRLCLQPLCTMMTAQFEVSCEHWELKQRSGVARILMGETAEEVAGLVPRDFQVTIAANNLHSDMHKQQMNLLLQPALWKCVPSTALTSQYRALAFMSLSRQGCVVHQLVTMVNTAFPTRLFTLMHHPEHLEQMQTLPRCVLGEFSALELELLSSCGPEDRLQRLQAYAAQWCTNISTIEARHASIRRGLHVKSVQTSALQFPFASADFVAQCIRRGEGSKLSSRRCIPKKLVKSRPKVLITVVKKGDKRSGGTWHAFTSLAVSGSRKSPNFRHVADMYRNRDKLNDEKLKRLGDAARQVGTGKNTRKYGVSNFGPKARIVKRVRDMEKRDRLYEHMEALALPFDERIAAMSVLSDFEAGHLKDFVLLCKRHMWLDAAQHAAAEMEMVSVLQRFEHTIGHDHKEQIKKLLPACASELDGWTAMPLLGGMCLQQDLAKHKGLARALDWAASTGRTNVLHSLQAEWQELHAPVMHEQCRPIDVAGGSMSRCQEYGFCNIVKELKGIFGSKKKGNPLHRGSVVCLFTSEASKSGIALPKPISLWLHCGLMYFKPIRPTFQLIYPAQPPIAEDAPPDCQYLEVLESARS
eukprot:2150823-Amphidinium_carterae.1